MPPAPSGATTSYGPRRTPDASGIVVRCANYMRRRSLRRTQKMPQVRDCERAETAITTCAFVRSRPDLRRHEARIAIEATMLRLKRAQREMLVDRLPDLGNLAAGGVRTGPDSRHLYLGGGWWTGTLGGVYGDVNLHRRRRKVSSGLAVLLGGLTLLVTLIGVLDMIGRRQDRKPQRR